MTAIPRLAAIDIGSNTIHLTVARPLTGVFDLAIVADESALVRLGADVAASGAIGEARLERAVAVIGAQVALARANGAMVILGMATEGVRAAVNATEVLERIVRGCALPVALVSGEQEAALTYWGATSGTADPGAPRAVLDLGGGSLELVVGEGTRVAWRVSLPLGSGALCARFAPSDPPRHAELERVRAVAGEMLAPLAVPLPVAEVTACGGAATTLLALAQRALDLPGAAMAPTMALTDERLVALTTLLERLPASEVARCYAIDPERAQLLGAGAAVLLAGLGRLGVRSVRVSRRGIREGALLAYARSGGEWLAAAISGHGWAT